MDLQRIYRGRLDRALEETQQYERTLRWISRARLGIFLSFSYFAFKTLQTGPNRLIWIIVFTLCLIMFLWLITKYQRIKAKHIHLTGIISINQNELMVMDGEQSILPDGSEFPFHRAMLWTWIYSVSTRFFIISIAAGPGKVEIIYLRHW